MLSMLDEMGWLANASAELRAEIARRADRITAREAQTIYRVGDPAGGIYCVLAGRLEMHLPRWGSEHSLAHVFGPGWWIGDLAAITGGPRRFDVSVQRDTVLLRLSKAEIDRTCGLFPEMYRHLLMMTTINMRLLIDAAEGLGFAGPTPRVAACLLRLDCSSKGWHGRLAVTQAEIGQMAKLSRRRTNAALKELAGAGIVDLGYAEIVIRDRCALTGVVEENGSHRDE